MEIVTRQEKNNCFLWFHEFKSQNHSSKTIYYSKKKKHGFKKYGTPLHFLIRENFQIARTLIVGLVVVVPKLGLPLIWYHTDRFIFWEYLKILFTLPVRLLRLFLTKTQWRHGLRMWFVNHWRNIGQHMGRYWLLSRCLDILWTINGA